MELNRVQFTFLVFVTLFIVSCSFRKGTDIQNEYAKALIQSTVDSIYAVHPNSNGIIVHVEAPNRGMSWSFAKGYANLESKKILEADQPILIASSIKPIMSASVLKLIEQGHTNINAPIRDLISPKSRDLFESDGYDLDSICIKHLLSHTSGIQDYIHSGHREEYLSMVDSDKQHRWSRDEQLELTIEVGDPLGVAKVFNYADANYILVSEILEHFTKKPFYEAVRELIDYEAIGMDETWFHTLEPIPSNTKPLAHQYWASRNWDSYEIDTSFDLYGGGGIACTAEDLAIFSHSLFNHEIVNPEILKNIFTQVTTSKKSEHKYYLGLGESSINGLTAYGHGGFWGTVFQYFPELDVSIAVYVLERDMGNLRKDILESVVAHLK